MEQRAVVVGVGGDDDVVMIPEAHAIILARLHETLRNANTWGEFKRLAPEGYYQEAVERTFDGEDEPTSDAPFEAMSVYGYGDADWPDWPAQQMLTWVPAEVQARFGQSVESVLNGPFLQLKAADVELIMEAMEALGYPCRRDDELIDRAHGN